MAGWGVVGAYAAAPDRFSQLALALSALLALARSVVSARCIGTSFVGSFFDPRPTPPPPPPPPPLLHPPATSLAEIQAAHSGNMLNSSVYHQPTPPTPAPAPDKQPPASVFAIYAHNSRCYLLEGAAVHFNARAPLFCPRRAESRAGPCTAMRVCVCDMRQCGERDGDRFPC